jgi:hypothetical protein
VQSIYEKDGDHETFEEEYKLAASIYKSHRIAEIRNPKMKKLNQDEIFEKISKKYRTVWYNLFRDQDMMEEIQKDVRRTRQEIGFFIKPLNINRELTDEERKKVDQQFDMTKISMTDAEKECYIETHSDPFFNILFIYAKLNPGINYVQGMNEVLAMIYYCFFKDQGLYTFA